MHLANRYALEYFNQFKLGTDPAALNKTRDRHQKADPYPDVWRYQFDYTLNVCHMQESLEVARQYMKDLDRSVLAIKNGRKTAEEAKKEAAKNLTDAANRCPSPEAILINARVHVERYQRQRKEKQNDAPATKGIAGARAALGMEKG